MPETRGIACPLRASRASNRHEVETGTRTWWPEGLDRPSPTAPARMRWFVLMVSAFSETRGIGVLSFRGSILRVPTQRPSFRRSALVEGQAEKQQWLFDDGKVFCSAARGLRRGARLWPGRSRRTVLTRTAPSTAPAKMPPSAIARELPAMRKDAGQPRPHSHLPASPEALRPFSWVGAAGHGGAALRCRDQLPRATCVGVEIPTARGFARLHAAGHASRDGSGWSSRVRA